MNAVTKINVWDPLVRLFHWSLVAAFATAYLTEGDRLGIHTFAGYTILALLAFRLVWGLSGPRYARFSDFVQSPRRVLAYLGDLPARRAPRYIGHNPAGGLMIVALLASLLLTTLSGVALYGAAQGEGPLAPVLIDLSYRWSDVLQETHVFLANLTLILVAVHLLGVVTGSLLHKENLVRAMLDGRKRA